MFPIGQPDHWVKFSVKKGKFSATLGPETHRNDDGTTWDAEGAVAGRFNASKTTISGTWALKVTDHGAAGAVTDTCDSGSMNWKAKQ